MNHDDHRFNRNLPAIPENDIVLNSPYRHYKGGFYTPMGFIFCADRDFWCVKYISNYDHQEYSRKIEYFIGAIEDGRKRFTPTGVR
jgi:hypothetical protein